MKKEELSERLENALLKFVERVADNEQTTSAIEKQIMPEVASVLATLISKKTR